MVVLTNNSVIASDSLLLLNLYIYVGLFIFYTNESLCKFMARKTSVLFVFFNEEVLPKNTLDRKKNIYMI